MNRGPLKKPKTNMKWNNKQNNINKIPVSWYKYIGVFIDDMMRRIV